MRNSQKNNSKNNRHMHLIDKIIDEHFTCLFYALVSDEFKVHLLNYGCYSTTKKRHRTHAHKLIASI